MSRSYPDELFRDISRSCLLHTAHTMQRCQPLCFALSIAALSLTCARSKLHEARADTPQLLNTVHPTSTGSVCSHCALHFLQPPCPSHVPALIRLSY